MRGIVYLGDRRVEVKDLPDPRPGVNEVLVRMKVSGLCGSDMRTYRQPTEVVEERGLGRLAGGHEPAGVVEAVGEGVWHVKVGDRVCVFHWMGCGHCEQCLAGNLMLCEDDRRRRGVSAHVHGGFADLLLVDERNCLPLPDELSFEVGAMIACCTGTAYSATKKIDVSGVHTLVIFGLGPVGLNAVSMGKARGARVIGVDLIEERLQLAKQLGADEVIDARKCNPVTEIRNMTRSRGADRGLEASGNPIAQGQIVDSMAYDGELIFVGGGYEEKGIKPGQIRGRVLKHNFIYPIYEYWEIVRCIMDHDLRLERMVTHRFSIEDAEEAFSLFDTGKTGKVVFVWD